MHNNRLQAEGWCGHFRVVHSTPPEITLFAQSTRLKKKDEPKLTGKKQVMEGGLFKFRFTTNGRQ
jgi:hypothetical protein